MIPALRLAAIWMIPDTLPSVPSTGLQNSGFFQLAFMPMFNFEFRYTFADSRTQIYAGNTLEDFLRFDLAAQAGVRQEMPDSSVVAASFVFSSIPAEVWEDPYMANQSRKETDRSAQGLRLSWGNILDTNLDVRYTWRD